GGAGSDAISNYADNVSIYGGAGNDSIWNDGGDNVTINAGAGNDYIRNYGCYNVTINAGAGNDDIYNSGDSVTINAGTGNDSISNSGDSVTIDGGEGADSIENWGKNATISGGDGNDYIHNGGGDAAVGLAYVYGSGNDTIENFDPDTNALVIAGSTWTSLRRNDNYGTLIIKVKGKGTITLLNYWSDKINIVSSLAEAKHYNIIRNDGQNNTVVTGTDTHDYIYNGWWQVANVTINGKAGDDFIYNNGSKISINGGKGDDLIKSYGDKVSIDGGDGNDLISNAGINAIISGGKGNDYIVKDGYAVGMTYVYSEGNDTINGYNDDRCFNNSQSIVITDSWSSVRSGDDIIIKVKGKGTIKLLDNPSTRTNIVSSLADAKFYNLIQNFTANKVIKGTSGEDAIVSKCANNVTINGAAVDDYIGIDDCIKVTANGGNGNDVIVSGGGCQRVLLNGGNGNDSIIVSGYCNTVDGGDGNDSIRTEGGANMSLFGGAGDDTVITWGDENTLEGGKGNDVIYVENHENILVKYTQGDGNDIVYDFNENSMLQIGNGSGTYSTVKSVDDIIVTVGNGKITLAGAANLSSININDKDKYIQQLQLNPSTVLTYKGHRYCIYSKNVEWSGAKFYCEELGGHLVTITDSGEQTAIQNFIAQHGEGESFWTGGTDEDTEGTWKWVTGEKFGYTNWASNQPDNAENHEHYLEICKAEAIGNDDWSNGVWNDRESWSGKGFICEWDDTNLITLTEGNDTYNNTVNGVTINALGANDTIRNYTADSVSVDGGRGNDHICNGDSQHGSGDSVTINAGAGNDTILNDIAGEIEAGRKASITGGGGNDWIANDGFYSTVDGGDGDDSINNCGANSSVNGGDGNDTIENFPWYDGEAVNVSICGGKGNDYISNVHPASGAQGSKILFQYTSGDGNDVIEGFNETSTLQISGGKYSSTKSGKN
ncbi:MAG: hypothetical protein J5497_01800, partial [Selenomonadaceae bacterium]|nr:hypothetical protein [Selenomonadaceae bacterium]